MPQRLCIEYVLFRMCSLYQRREMTLSVSIGTYSKQGHRHRLSQKDEAPIENLFLVCSKASKLGQCDRELVQLLSLCDSLSVCIVPRREADRAVIVLCPSNPHPVSLSFSFLFSFAQLTCHEQR